MRTICFLLFLVTTALGGYKVVDSIPKGTSVSWKTGDTILLTNTVFVDSSILKIEPGVVVKAKKATTIYSEDDGAYVIKTCPTLVITPKGFIDAQGTADKPIIFTPEIDTLTKKNDVKFATSDSFLGYWGGVVILGSARISKPGGTARYTPVSENDNRCIYGGNDDTDSSGVLRYVSIRYAGTNHYTTKDQYRNCGLALCGVGSKTVLEHIDVHSAYKNGVRIYGGKCNLKYISSNYPGNNAFHFDMGYRGCLQFLTAILSTPTLDCFGVRLGGTAARTDTPYTCPTITNSTIISNLQTTGSVIYTQNAAGYVYNSVFVNVSHLSIETGSSETSWKRKGEGLVAVEGNVFWNYDAPSNPVLWDDFASASDSVYKYFRFVNAKYNPKIIAHEFLYPLDLRPDSSICWGNGKVSSDADIGFNLGKKVKDPFIDVNVCYIGAFDPSKPMWIRNWTGADYDGMLSTKDSARVKSDSLCPTSVSVKSFNTKESTPQMRLSGSQLNIRFQSTGECRDAVLRVYNLKGICIVSKNLGLTKGINYIGLNRNALTSGLYLFKITTSNSKVLLSTPVMMP